MIRSTHSQLPALVVRRSPRTLLPEYNPEVTNHAIFSGEIDLATPTTPRCDNSFDTVSIGPKDSSSNRSLLQSQTVVSLHSPLQSSSVQSATLSHATHLIAPLATSQSTPQLGIHHITSSQLTSQRSDSKLITFQSSTSPIAFQSSPIPLPPSQFRLSSQLTNSQSATTSLSHKSHNSPLKKLPPCVKKSSKYMNEHGVESLSSSPTQSPKRSVSFCLDGDNLTTNLNSQAKKTSKKKSSSKKLNKLARESLKDGRQTSPNATTYSKGGKHQEELLNVCNYGRCPKPFMKGSQKLKEIRDFLNECPSKSIRND